LRILFVSSEIYPLAKSGGLADVSAALPMALTDLGADMHLLLPGYPLALEKAANKSVELEIADFMGGGLTRLIAARTPDTGLPLWIIDCPALFRRPGGLYQDGDGADWCDNAKRFAVLSHAAAQLARGAWLPGWHADVVHANDWHAGLIAPLIAFGPGKKPGTVFTLHNLAYQGTFPASVFPELGLPEGIYNPEGVEFYGKVSFLKAGIRYSDQLTTVSPTYAREALTPDFGCGLEGLLQSRRQDFTGILNGVDYDTWDPSSDRHLPQSYGARSIIGKRRCKQELQLELKLDPIPDMPLLIYMSRMTSQKMTDVVLEALPTILDHGVQLAVLGKGDPALEERLQSAGLGHPGRIATRIGYDEPLAHRFQAGADILLHPSRFEPCGLTQLYAMRYGTLPIVRRVGGLADTIVDTNDRTVRDGTATGFTFEDATAASMVEALDRALSVYRQPLLWRKVQRTAMTQDFGWEQSARRYIETYQRCAPGLGAAGDRIEQSDQAGKARLTDILNERHARPVRIAANRQGRRRG
jgi:starch synthase